LRLIRIVRRKILVRILGIEEEEDIEANKGCKEEDSG